MKQRIDNTVWRKILNDIQGRITEVSFHTWIQPLQPIEIDKDANLPYTVENPEKGLFVIEGPRIEKMLGYTNLDSEKGFQFFQRFLKESGILKDLEQAGIQEGDTVQMYGHQFDYYK